MNDLMGDKEALHYLRILQEKDGYFQKEMRDAIDHACNVLANKMLMSNAKNTS